MISDLRHPHVALATIIIAALCAFSAPLKAQDAVLPDNLVAQVGLNQLPDDLRSRWLLLRTEVDPAQYGDYLREGELTIKQLGELILAVGGTPPSQDQPAYGVFADLQDNLLAILDQIELALILKMPDDNLSRMLGRYRSEKDELSTQTRADRNKLIEAGTRLLKSHENDPYFLKYPHRRAVLADLYFRLTELLYAEAYDEFLEQTDHYLATLDSLRKVDPQGAQHLAQPQPDYSRVMAMYQRIVDEFPTSDYSDDALYNLGLLTATGETASDLGAANRLYETLVRIYPESEYKLNCLRRIGEYYFNPPVNDLAKAVSIYEQIVAEFPNSEYSAESYYKLGWCHYRLSDLPTAVEYFAKSLDVGYHSDSSAIGATGLDIASESINYIGVCFAVDPRDWAGSGVGNMAAWLLSHPDRMQRYGREVVLQLGEIYRHQVGRYADAVIVYNKYLELWALDTQAPTVLSNIIDIYQSGEIFNPQAAHTEKIRFFQSYNPDTEWWRVNDNQKIRDAISPVLENNLNMIIEETLVLATDSKDPALYKEFEQDCRQYLRLWPKGPHAYQTQYNLASVLERQKGREVAAIREYWVVATAYSDSTNRNIASQRVIALAQDLLKQERSGAISMTVSGDVEPPVMRTSPAPAKPADSTAAPQKGAERTPLLNSERLLLAAFDQYLGVFPASALTPTILYQAGDILYQHEWFGESRKYLEKLISEHPESKFTEDAYKLVLEGYFKNGDYADVEMVAGRILASSASKDLKESAKRRKAESVFLTASSLKEGNDHLAAAAAYKRVALDSPDYQYADRSLFQSGLEYMQAANYKNANEVFLILADRYPKSEYSDKAIYNAGFNLQSQMKDLAGSAALYERLVRAFPKSDLAQGALSNASVNYNQVGDDRAAVRVNTLYVQMYPAAEDASVYLFENASHFMKLGEVDKANEIYQQFAAKYPTDPRTVQAFYERGKFALDKGDRVSASREFTATLDVHQKLVARGLPGSPKYASQSLDKLLEWEQAEYEKVRFTGTDAQVKAAKERKKQWRNALVDKYQQLIRFGRKEAYRAFYAMGRLDEDFALATYQQDIPVVKDQQAKIDNLAKVIDEAILLNTVAQQSYKNGYDGLRGLSDPLRAEQIRQHSEYDRFSAQIAELQKDTSAVGVSDSLVKQTALQKNVSEIDSATVEAAVWSDSCRHKIPEVALFNGAYLAKLWYANFSVRSNDKDEEIRLLFREEAIKNVIAPMAPEVIGLYMQGWNAAKEVGLGQKWRMTVEVGYRTTVDSLMAQYIEQINLAQKRTDKLIGDFTTILPKGEEAKTPQGYFSDELGQIILDQVDFINTFTLDMLTGFQMVLDTVAIYKPPYGFGENANDAVLRFALDQSDNFTTRSADAAEKTKAYGAKYDETSKLQWDDGRVAFEDIGTNFRDYSLALLDKSLEVRKKYALSGLAGIEIVEKLVNINPERYGAEAGLSSQSYTVVSNTDWNVWPVAVEGFQNPEFDDFDWKHATLGGFPAGTKLGTLDSLGAQPIWFNMDKPTPTMGMLPGYGSATQMALLNVFRQLDPDSVTSADTTGSDSGWVEEVFESPAETPAIAPAETSPADPVMEAKPTEEQPVPDLEAPSVPDVQPQVQESAPPPEDSHPPVEQPAPGDQAPPVVTPESAPETPEATVAPIITPSSAPVISPEADSIYRAWTAPDSTGLRRYWFRRTFTADAKPSAGHIWITCDDDFSLFINGTFVVEDGHKDVDWMNPGDFDIGNFLQEGRNVIAVEASDVNNTRQGLEAGLVYEIVPDISKQIASLHDREVARDRQLKAQADVKYMNDEKAILAVLNPSRTSSSSEAESVAEASVVSKPAESAPAVVAPTPDELRIMRIIEKNKLR